MLAISIPQLDFMETFKEQLNLDDEFQELLVKVQPDPVAYPHYKIIDW
jgi:hypothetical protein